MKKRLRRFFRILFLLIFLLVIGLFVIGMRMSFRTSDAHLEAYFASQNTSAEINYLPMGQDSLRYVVSGNLDTKWAILFVHGAPGGLGMFQQYLAEPELGKKALLISVDRPGYGYSAYGKSETSIPRQSEIINQILAEYPEHQFLLYGHSFGGPIVGYMAYLRPDRIRGAIIAGGAVDPGQERFVWLARFCNTPPVKWIGVADTWVASDEKIAHPGQLAAMADIWQQIEAKLFIQHGTEDWMVPYENVAFLQERVPEKQLFLEALEGESHFFFNDMATVKGILLKSLKELE